MKKIYLWFLLAGLFTSLGGCSKDFLKNYEDRIDDGTWELYDVDHWGAGSNMGLSFTGGFFQFDPSGQLHYKDDAGNEYEGTWNMDWKEVNGSCTTDDNGNTTCTNRTVRTLQLAVVSFQTREMLTDYFDEILFTGTDRFRAYIYTQYKTHVFYFKR
jgi:hypothetical protein